MCLSRIVFGSIPSPNDEFAESSGAAKKSEAQGSGEGASPNVTDWI